MKTDSHGGSPAHNRYRADIDGLRAVAVSSVIAFHLFSSRGGFIGVDIFFVISGFLISRIIFEDMEVGEFSLLDFYGRRIRRIFPALIAVITSCLIFGWFYLLADEYELLGKHVGSGVAFISNFVLWKESGYFDAISRSKPLLHLWSLGIEEQYYIVWPIIVYGLWHSRKHFFTALLGIALVSFALNIYLIETSQAEAFYSPLPRAWELLIGSLLAYVLTYKPRVAQCLTRFPNLSSLAGCFLILICQLKVKESAFPGWWALMPTFGAALIISAGPRATFNKYLLSSRPFVWIGLISYPLYLWHWPVIASFYLTTAQGLSRSNKFVALSITFVCAVFTYALLERSVRKFGRSSRLLVPALLTLLAAVGIAGVLVWNKKGFPSRSAASAGLTANGDIGQEPFHAYHTKAFRPCLPVRIRALIYDNRCFQKVDGPIDIAIVGDSHAEHLFLGLSEALTKKNIVYYLQITIPRLDRPSYATIFANIADSPTIRTVILTSYWWYRISELTSETSLSHELNKIAEFLRSKGKRLIITDDVPSFSFEPKLCKYAARFKSSGRCAESDAFFNLRRAEYISELEHFAAQNPDVGFVRTSEFFCKDHVCSMVNGSDLLFRDHDHLNIEGSKFVGRKILEVYPELNQ